MTKYINNFSSVSAATEATGLLSPNVTYVHEGEGEKILVLDCGDGDEVKITGSTIADLGIEKKPAAPEGFVDLGLSVYWAKWNLGAENEQDYGKYYAWGDISGATQAEIEAATPTLIDNGYSREPDGDMGPLYCWTKNDEIIYTRTEEVSYRDVVFNDEPVMVGAVMSVEGDKISYGSFIFDYTWYANQGLTGITGDLTAANDAATVALGEGYRMPTEAECQELIDNTNHETGMTGTIKGMFFTSKTDSTKKIFIPFACFAGGGNIFSEVDTADVWSSNGDERNACRLLCIMRDSECSTPSTSRCYGNSIRPVCPK